jgi:glycosyltransferase involved in cell wall biosynthesis
MSDASITVVIPAYNEAERIGTAIESVLAQTLAPAEILVVDDGSTDATARVAAAYPVRVLSKPNGGISSARNAGLRAARGSWIALLDADDRWMPDRLEWLARAAATRPQSAFGFSDHRVLVGSVPNAPSNFEDTPQYRCAAKIPLAPGIVAIPREVLGRALAVGNFIGTSTIFARTAEIRAHGLYFDETLPRVTDLDQTSEDVEWYLRVLKWTDAVVVERVLADYVRGRASLASGHARVRMGDVRLGERVAADPERYVAGAATWFRAYRRQHYRNAASIAMRGTDFRRARAILREAQRERFTLYDGALLALAYAADCRFGRTLTALLRASVRRLKGRT